MACMKCGAKCSGEVCAGCAPTERTPEMQAGVNVVAQQLYGREPDPDGIVCVSCGSGNMARVDFTDELSWRESKISTLCQRCQDGTFLVAEAMEEMEEEEEPFEVPAYKPPPERPCSDCPFRRASMPGWLGEHTLKGFVGRVLSDQPMECHQTVDYSDPDWIEQLRRGEVSYCAGALTFFANTCKLSRDPERPRKDPDHESVFSSITEFIAHHKGAGTDDE